ncbi:MAG: aminopeptidase P family protein [Candidatus Cloacimonadaceae bacterium]|nr:aminopeptidase P family protein [Candidatus Cloacimonadota bacterium]
MDSEITRKRREKLAEQLGDNESAIVFAKPEISLEKFSQDSNFLYFTGINEPELIYVVAKVWGKLNEVLFIERGNPERVVWEGVKLSIDEAKDISGIQQIRYKDEFYPFLSGICSQLTRIYSNLGYPMLCKPPSYPLYMLQPIQKKCPYIEIKDLNDMITPLRLVKDEWEIQQLQRAIDITGLGIRDILHTAKAGMMEYELEATLFYRMQVNGLQQWGFAPIIAAGVNAATLHYEKNNCQIQAGDLVLMDVGASCNGYSADITRCFPIDQKFSSRQTEIYNIVLDVNKKIIELIKPGIEMSVLNNNTVEWLAEGMLSIGLINSREEVRKYYMHSVSHFLGLETHDVGGREAVLVPGNVITVEPGIYIPEEKLGVRIEDDVLVTDNGHQVLSAGIPKEISDIESIRQEALQK